MGEKKIKFVDPNWRNLGRVLTLAEVAWILQRSRNTVLDMRRAGILKAVNDQKPYTFDPEHIYQYAFGNRAHYFKDGTPSSLKIEDEGESVHKPLAKAKKGDLWT